jgi:hypothetical protein
MPQALPANPDLDWLKKAAKKRLAELRLRVPESKLHQAQFAVAADYGFTSWRALKAHIDDVNGVADGRVRVFKAARDGDVEAVRRALAAGFDPATQDRDGRTIYQIAKDRGAIRRRRRAGGAARCKSGADRRTRRARPLQGYAPVSCRAAQPAWRDPAVDRARGRSQQA